MNEKYNYLTKNVILFFISTFGSKLITFLLVPLYTNFMTTSDYGGIDLVSTVISISLPVLSFSLESSLVRFCLDEKYSDGKVIATSAHIWVRAIAFNILFAACLFGIGLFRNIENFYIYYLCFYLLRGTNEILSSIYRGTDRVGILVETTLISTLALCLFNILFLAVFKMGVIGYVLSLAISLFASIIWGLIRTRVRFDWHDYDKSINRDMIKYGGPLVFNQLGWWINNSVDKYIVLYFLGLSQNGVYSIAYKIPTVISVISAIFSNAWGLSAIKAYGTQDSDAFASKMFNLFNSLLVLSCSVILILNVPLAKLLFAKEFYEAWKFTGILVVATTFNGLSGFLGAFFSAAKDTRSYALSTIAGGIINVLVSIILVNSIQNVGVAMGTLVSYVSILIIRYIRCKKYVNLSINWVRAIVMYVLLFAECYIGMQGFNQYICSIQILLFVILIIMNYRELIRIVEYAFRYAKERIRKNGETGD